MTETKMQRVLGYARISSDSQKENTSIKEQIKRIQAYCISQGYELIKIYKDEAKSASTTDNREEYNKMLEYIKDKDNDIDAIVVFKSDRIHRHLKNLLIMIEDELNTREVAFISVSENFDTSLPQGMLTLQMLGSFAEFEKNLINERTKLGRIVTAKSGAYAGGKIPYGYAAENGKLIIIEVEARNIKIIFKLYSEGKSYDYIAKYLNRCHELNLDKTSNSGIHMENASQGNSSTNYKIWSRTSICYILKNQIYTGIYSYNGKKEENDIKINAAIPAIISKRLFNKVQNIRNQKKSIRNI